MKNREKFLETINNMSNEELAEVLCRMNDCGDCQVENCKGIKSVVDWLGVEDGE